MSLQEPVLPPLTARPPSARRNSSRGSQSQSQPGSRSPLLNAQSDDGMPRRLSGVSALDDERMMQSIEAEEERMVLQLTKKLEKVSLVCSAFPLLC